MISIRDMMMKQWFPKMVTNGWSWIIMIDYGSYGYNHDLYAKPINQVVLRWENRLSVMAQMVLVPENHKRRDPLVMFVGVEPPYLHQR